MFRKKQTLGTFLFEYLYQEGIHDAFGIPGDFVLPTFRYLDASPINIITMTHEPSVGFAADCYARSRGFGLAIVTYCVGGLNMLNAIACAYAEKSPVLVISGAPSVKDHYRDPMVHHKVRTFESQQRIYEEVTCTTAVLSDPKTAAEEIVRVVQEIKRTSRPGYIEVPFDMVDVEIPLHDVLLHPKTEPESDNEALAACVDEIVKKINAARQPVIIAGEDLHRHRLTDLAARLAKEHNIPIAATLMGKSVVRENNPLYIGVYSGAFSEKACQEYVDNSDCVIMLGGFVSDVFLGFYSVTLDRQKTIILNSEKAHVGLHSYEFIQFKDVLEKLVVSDIRHRSDFVNPNPVKLCEPLQDTHRTDPITVESMFDIFSTHIEEGDTIVCDTGDALVGAIGLRTGMRSHFFADAYYLSMGFAAPASIGAMVANRDSKTFAIIGDGAFQMTGMEFSTAAKYKLAPVVIVINNDGYGTQRHIVDGDFNNINMWRYDKVVDVLGYGESVQVRTKGEFDNALKKARTHDQLYLIEIIVPRHECSSSLKRMAQALGKLRNKK